jgi:putative DNA primase/helicase
LTATKRSDGRITSIEKMARHRVAVHSREFNTQNVLNLQNGTLDLGTFSLYPHRQTDNLTYVLPYAYNATATAPRWESFLREVLVRPVLDSDGNATGVLETDEELIRLYQELWGYSLTTLTHHQVLVFQVGEGGNGKSVAIKLLGYLLGDQLSTTLDFTKLGAQGNYDIARIPGKRVLLSTESSKGSYIPEDTLKKISDGEPLTANQKYETPYEFVPVGKIWWSMNHLPRITDTTMSIWRRFKIIPFRRSFSEKDGTADIGLVDKLVAELPGILNWALLGWERLLNTGRFTQAGAVEEEVNTYRASSNPVRLWLEERCKLRKQDGKPYPPTTKASDVYDDYLTWCDANGFDKRATVNSREFAHEMQRLGYPSKRSSAGMLYPLVLELPMYRSKDDAAN